MPSPVCCFLAALRSILYASLEGGRGGATDRLLGAGGEGSWLVSTTVGAGVVFFTGRLVRGGTGGMGLLGAPRFGVLGDCGAAVLVGGAVSAALSVTSVRGCHQATSLAMIACN